MEGSLIYLASPYTHDDKAVEAERYERISLITVGIMNTGLQVFSPIAAGVPLAKFGGLPTDWAYWEESCKVMISRCQRFIVIQFDGWDVSVGVLAEIEYAKSLGIAIEYLDPNEFGEEEGVY